MRGQHNEVVLESSALHTITSECCQRLPVEVGGILLGFRDGQRVVVVDVLVVTTPGATTTRYVRDDVQANRQLHEFLAARDPKDPVGYVGEWHSHPAPVGPSRIDLKAIGATARATAGPIALVVFSAGLTPAFSAVIAARRRTGRTFIQESRVVMPSREVRRLGSLPEGAVRGDGPIFISYRQSDGSEHADSLEGLLRAAGLVVWRDHSDLRAGTTVDRLEQALTDGLSAGVLVVTPEIAKSSIVRERELPRLLQLDEDRAFSLSVANAVTSPTDPDKVNFAAPDCLLGLAPLRRLGDKKQSNARTLTGRLEIVRDLLMHRIEQRKAAIAAHGGVFSITTQTRPEPFALEAGESDLHIRIRSAPTGRLPSAQGLYDLQATLPLTSDAVRAAGTSTVSLAGGMHLSVALAIGAALPETKIGHIEVTDLRNGKWTSRETDDPELHTVVTRTIDGEFAFEDGRTAKVAVLVTLTANPDESGFQRLIGDRPGVFAAAMRVDLAPSGSVHEAEAARLAVQIAGEIKRCSAQYGRAEVHLAYHGPHTMAVLIGRLLNTLRTVVYEWDDPEGSGPSYTPVLTIEPGVTLGPITHVLL